MIELKSTTVKERFIEYSKIVLMDGYKPDPCDKASANSMLNDFENGLGIRLAGDSGTGKSIFFEIIQRITPPTHPYFYSIIDAPEFVKRFNIEGHEVFDLYKNKNVLINDLGAEDKGMYYGDRVEVIERFIEYRYKDFQYSKLITHITTNLTLEEITNRYFERCKTRLQEMCNFYQFRGTSKRQLKNFKEFIPVKHLIVKTQAELDFEKTYADLKQSIIDNPPPKVESGLGERMKRFFDTVLPKSKQNI